jgi:hypothetical protein
MSNSYRIRSLLLAAMGLLVVGVSAQAQATPAPYLYYFSPIPQGIVVERADGIDSRVIAPDLILADYTLSRCSKDGQNEIVFGHEQTH